MTKKQSKRLLIPEIEMYLTEALPGFSCNMCAACCRRKMIPLYQVDIERLNRKAKNFYERTTRIEQFITGAKYKMRMIDEVCVFLSEGLCKNYDLRPNTCRRHPFLVTEKHTLVSSTCPGVDWNVCQSPEEYRKLSSDIVGRIDIFLKRLRLDLKNSAVSTDN